MSGWIVYSKDGGIERCKLKSLEYGGTAMGERAVTATFDYHSEVAFEVFDYIEYRGERFELEAVPTVKKLSSFEYQYELRFVSLKYELERCEMRDLVPSDNGVVYPTPLTFSFTGDVRYLTDRIQACLDAMYGADVWKIIIADGTSSEEKNISIAQQNCWNALALVNSTYGLNFYIKGRTITIGGEQPLVSHTFEYGKGNGLYEIERASDTETGIVTKLRAYGSTRNLDYSYPKKPEWSDSVLPVSFALSPLRLMLPSFKTDGKTDYVLADEAAIAKYGIREASMVYDDIYPSIAGATYNGQAIDEIKAVDAVDESQKTFVVYLHDLGFDLEEHLTTSDAQISMKSGALQGYTFTISAIDKQTGGYKITLGKNSLENSEESGAYVPGVNWNMKAGDKFVLLNILMPQKYIRDAENRLLARAEEYLAQYSKTNFSYNIGMHDKFLIQNPSVYESLIEGSKLKVYDKEIGIDEEVTIQSITITENLEDNILPQVKVTLNNEPSASTLDRIQGKLNEVAAETAANGFTTQSEIMAQYRRKLDKPFFDKLFVAIDANGNEIASTDVITPIAYIKAKYHVASVGGFTMYAMDKDVDVPSLASGLPFDGRTIWYNPDTQQIEVIGGTGGGSGEGVSNFWDLSGIPSWITKSKPKYTYSEIEGTPDLSKYALTSQIPSLSGYATESWVLQKDYATKATTLSGYGITDAYTKTNVDDLLKSYVTLSGSQIITGEKNFTGGLKVNDSLIYYDKEKKYWKLEGDLLVTGGVTMYGSDSSFTTSTIMDALLYDDTTLGINSNGQLYVKGGAGGGINTTDLQNYLTQNSYLNVTSGDNRYLKLSGGTMSGVITMPINHQIQWGSSSLMIYGEDNNTVKIFAPSGLYVNSKEVWHSGNFTPSNYLPLTGGILDGVLTLRASNSSSDSWIEFSNKSNSVVHKLGVRRPESSYGLQYYNGSEYYKIWHEGNFTPSNYLPLSGGTLSGNLALGYNKLYIGDGSDNFYIGWGANNMFVYQNYYGHYFTTKGERRMTINGSGNVGIGTENPTSKLSVQGSGDYFGFLYLNNYGASGNKSGASLIINKGDDYFGIGPSDKNVSNMSFGTTSNSTGTWKSEIITITNDGYVGIGTTSPTKKLHIYRESSSNDALLLLERGGSYDSRLELKNPAGLFSFTQQSTGNAFITLKGNHLLFFETSDTARLTIDGSGNVGIGTTNPSSLLHVNGDGRIAGVHFRGSFINLNRDGATGAIYDSTKTALEIESTASVSILRTYNVTTQASISLHTNGNIGIGTINPLSKLHVNGVLTLPLNNQIQWADTDGAMIYGTSGKRIVVDGAIIPSATRSHNLGSSDYMWNRLYVDYIDTAASRSLKLYTEGTEKVRIDSSTGNVGIGTTNPQDKLDVAGNIMTNGGLLFTRVGTGTYNKFTISSNTTYGVEIEAPRATDSATGTALPIFIGWRGGALGIKITSGGNLLANGGITMYSDQRKKTILNHVELSLKQIAEAPLIEHYYNSDDKKTTHVGSIAQYWASMNDWFCKLDSEGYYTMEIQNAALASAISIARELDRYETKTDKAIKKLKKRICELEEEVERLKSA